MSIFYKIVKILSILFVGALGALAFNLFLFPYLLTNPYFEKFSFVKDFKESKIVLNTTEQVYIQENVALQDAILRAKKSIVAVKSKSIASGLIVTSDGLVVTLASAISPRNTLSISWQGEAISFSVIKVDMQNNLALLKINSDSLSTVGFADPNKIKIGQRVFLVAVTSQYAKETQEAEGQDDWLVNEGIIREKNTRFLKTNISEKQIVSGSPLFNSTGELVGVNALDTEGRVVAVPAEIVKNFIGL